MRSRPPGNATGARWVRQASIPHRTEDGMTNKSKPGLTAIRIPLLVVVALLVMLLIGILIYTTA